MRTTCTFDAGDDVAVDARPELSDALDTIIDTSGATALSLLDLLATGSLGLAAVDDVAVDARPDISDALDTADTSGAALSLLDFLATGSLAAGEDALDTVDTSGAALSLLDFLATGSLSLAAVADVAVDARPDISDAFDTVDTTGTTAAVAGIINEEAAGLAFDQADGGLAFGGADASALDTLDSTDIAKYLANFMWASLL